MAAKQQRQQEEDSLSSFVSRPSTLRVAGASSSSSFGSLSPSSASRGSGGASSSSASSSSYQPQARSPTAAQRATHSSLGDVPVVHSQFAGLGIAGRDELPVALKELRDADKRVEALRRQANGLITSPPQNAEQPPQGQLPTHVLDALELYDQALVLQPLNDALYEEKARVLAQNYAMQDALGVISRWLKHRPYSRVAFTRQLQILTHQARWKELATAALVALELYPADAVCAQLLGNALRELTQAKESLPADLDAVLAYGKLQRKVYQPVGASASFPSPRSGHTATAGDKGRVWIFGGSATESPSDTTELFNDIFVLTSSSASSFDFVEVQPVARAESKRPCERTLHAAAFAGSKLYVYGGRNKSGASLADLWTFDTARSEWKLVASQGDAPPAVCGHSLTRFDNQLIMFGGQESAFSCNNSIYSFDLETLTWSRPAVAGTKPYARCGHSATLLPGSSLCYILGGWNGSLYKCYFDDVHVLDLASMTWSTPKLSKKSPPGGIESRAYHAAALMRDHTAEDPNALAIFIAGGSNKQGKLADIKMLSLGSMVISQPKVFGALPFAADGFSLSPQAASSGAPVTAIFFGGASEQGTIDSSTILHLDALLGGGIGNGAHSNGSSAALANGSPSSKSRRTLEPLGGASDDHSSPQSKPRLAPLKPLGSSSSSSGSAITFDKAPLKAASSALKPLGR